MSHRLDQRWSQLLAAAAPRNEPAELTPTDQASSHPKPIYRTRLLEVDDQGRIVVERPQTPGVMTLFENGVTLEITDPLGGMRLGGECELVGLLPFALNERMTVPALRLSAPRQVYSAQRRAFFRVDATATAIEPIVLTRLTEQPVALPGCGTVEGRLLDISGNGMALAVRGHDALKLLAVDSRHVCVLQLPQPAQSLAVEGRVVHHRSLTAPDVRVGIAFELDEAQENQAVEAQLVQFATWLQRQQLRRRRA